MASLTDWLARTFYISDQEEQDSADWQARSNAALDRQLNQGKIDLAEYLDSKAKVADTGTAYFDRELGKPGLPGVPALVPWWVWLLIGAAVFLYLGGFSWLKGILKK